MKNPGLSGNLMYTKGCIAFRRFFGTGETIPASKGMPLSSISTLKFRACKNCELGFDNHKNFEEEEWHEHIGNSGEGRNVGVFPSLL